MCILGGGVILHTCALRLFCILETETLARSPHLCASVCQGGRSQHRLQGAGASRSWREVSVHHCHCFQ